MIHCNTILDKAGLNTGSQIVFENALSYTIYTFYSPYNMKLDPTPN